jgi:signal transduction histidine kinase
MFRSALLKLTAVYVVMIMAICIVFSIVVDHVADTELHGGIYNQYSRMNKEYQSFGLRQTGTPDAEFAMRAQRIQTQIFYFNLLVLVVTTVACYLLARRTLRPIEAAHAQQKRFTADVSHELRTPLTALRMETEVSLLEAKAPAADLRRTLQSNLEEVDRMEVLINNLLLLSSMEANKLRTDFRSLDLQDVVKTAVQTVGKLAANKHIMINTELQSKQVNGDSASLTQLFVILLENALKYSPVQATVSIAMAHKKGRVVVDIKDPGIGIPAEALPHVFDRFYRADSARSKDAADITPQGFGLGLSLAKLIADLHGAEIILTSTPGSGTIAAVILPIT